MSKTNTIKYTNDKISFIPTKEGAGIFKDNKKILELNMEEAKSLMICMLDFAHSMVPIANPTRGVKKLKSGKHKKQ